MSLMNPHVKWATSVGSVHDLVTVVERAFRIAREGVPGPVFIEVPVDLLYDEETVAWLVLQRDRVDRAKDVGSKVLKLYLERHLNKVFKPGPHRKIIRCWMSARLIQIQRLLSQYSVH